MSLWWLLMNKSLKFDSFTLFFFHPSFVKFQYSSIFKLFQVVATAGYARLGGVDFDERLCNHFVMELKKQTGIDISNNPRALVRLRDNCEKAKHILSSSTVAVIEIDSLYDGCDFTLKCTRELFETLCADLFNSCMDAVKKVLIDSRRDSSRVGEGLSHS